MGPSPLCGAVVKNDDVDVQGCWAFITQDRVERKPTGRLSKMKGLNIWEGWESKLKDSAVRRKP